MSKAMDEAKRLLSDGKITKEAYDKMASDRETILKLAWPKVLESPMARGLGLAALMPIIYAGAHAGLSGIQSLMEQHRLERSKQEMFEIDPSLAETPKEQVDQAFSFLSHFAPSVAKNPVSAANFVKNLTLMPAMGDAGVVKSLVDIERGAGTSGNEFLRAFVGGVGAQTAKNIQTIGTHLTDTTEIFHPKRDESES